MSPSAAIHRVHVTWVEEHAATVVWVVRNRQPIETAAADVAQRTIIGVAIARSREVDSSCLTAACPEIITEVVLVSLRIACTVNIEL